jgi:hypothetical protein
VPTGDLARGRRATPPRDIVSGVQSLVLDFCRSGLRDEMNFCRSGLRDEMNFCRSGLRDEMNFCRSGLRDDMTTLVIRAGGPPGR